MMAALQNVRAAALRRDVGRRMALCNLDEARVVDRVLQRLELGRDRYGHLDLARPRNWRQERCEERLDALVYDVCEELVAEDIERAQLHEDARRELVESEAHRHTAAGAESAPIALAELRQEAAAIELDELDDLQPYDALDLSGAEVS